MATAIHEPRRAGKLGKHPRRDDPRTLSFRTYRDRAVPAPPASRSWDHGQRQWGAMQNDRIGDCTCAAIGHALQITSVNTATEITVSDAAIVAAYSAVSGYDPRTGANDVGANMLDVQKYWQQTGVAGHKAVAFAACSTANLDDVKACINLFGFCNIGFQVPAHCIPDFEQGKTWDVQSANSSIIGGHDVILVDYDDATSLFTCITWGGNQKLTYAFFHAYVDEAYGVVLPEWIAANGEAPSGFDLPQLLTDVQELTQAPDPAPQPAPTPPPAVKTLADYDAPIKGVIQSGVYDLNAPDLVAYQLAWWQWAEGATVMKPDYQLPSRPHLAGDA